MSNAEMFGMMVMAAVSIGAVVYDSCAVDTEIIEYRKEVDYGDTVWSICGQVADDTVNLEKLVWQTMDENGIEEPGALKPGAEIVIHVPKKVGGRYGDSKE